MIKIARYKNTRHWAVWQEDKLLALGKLVASVAHEINNPLGTISLYAQMVLDDLEKDPDGCRQSLEVVLKQTNRAGRIVKDLLEFAHQSDPELAPVNINDVLEKAMAVTAPPAELQNVRWVTDLSPRIRGVGAPASRSTGLMVANPEAIHISG